MRNAVRPIGLMIFHTRNTTRVFGPVNEEPGSGIPVRIFSGHNAMPAQMFAPADYKKLFTPRPVERT